MVKLNHAIKLLDLSDEDFIYFKYYKDKSSHYEHFQVKHVKQYFDMKQIHVIKIEHHFTYDEDNGKDYEFLVNIPYEKILHARREVEERYIWK